MSLWRVVVADDHEMIRTGLRTVLEQFDCTVVGEAATGAEAVALVRELQPEFLVTDMVMPGLSGLEVVHQAAALSPATRMIIFSMHADDSYVREALRAGAMAYVLKESLSAELLTAIHHAVEGRRYVSPALSERVFDAYMQPGMAISTDSSRLLNAREREVLVLTAQGCTSAEIAEQLSLSLRTVENQRATLMRKLGLRTIADLVRYALRHGLISLDS
jgi:DNA-binding NarL/FixJ family response regulator